MNRIKIYVSDDTEYSEITSIDKGSRHDVIVQIKDEIFHPVFYNIFTLAQEYNESVSKGEVYEIDNNIILVEKLSKEEIIKTVLYLYEAKFFDGVKPINLEDEYKDSLEMFPKLKTLSGWTRIY